VVAVVPGAVDTDVRVTSTVVVEYFVTVLPCGGQRQLISLNFRKSNHDSIIGRCLPGAVTVDTAVTVLL